MNSDNTQKLPSSLTKDVFFRSHVVPVKPQPKAISTYAEPKWPKFVLVFDTETTLDPKDQSLLFGFYRVCRLEGSEYKCVEEGIVHADELRADWLEVIRDYCRAYRSEVVDQDCDERIHVYKRSDFVERLFFDAIRTRSLIVAFNAPFDISRLAISHRAPHNRAWTLVLAQRLSKKSGEWEPNPERPCVRVISKDSKSAFFSLTKPVRPEEWPTYKVGKKTRIVCRVLDLHTLAWGLFNDNFSLKRLCKQLHTKNQKQDHEPTGTVTREELNYCRQDVRCTVDALNALKTEFDKHPLPDLHPDKVVSPATIGKAILKAMGIVPPLKKFKVPPYINGIAAQAYFGGRAECRIRLAALPVVLTDFSSQYPTINSLLGNQDILIAESLSFDDATEDVRAFVERITLEDCFKQETWKQMKFFARIRPDGDVLPVRAEYNDDDVTKNIGVNHFTSSKPIWVSGPTLLASKLLTNGKVPYIEKAIRVVPHGQQKGLVGTILRGMVEIDPPKHNIFRVMVEQKEVYKEPNPALSYFLKICANATSYGMFFEVTPQDLFKPTMVKVYSGEHRREDYVTTLEKPGEWYFPPIAALITGGAHLLLAMLERCITDKGGRYLFCDTDSMCVVASKDGGPVPCPGEPTIKALSWNDVREISDRFTSLNCYDRTKVKGSILKIEKVNFVDGNQVQLYGSSISAKRYFLYRYDRQGNIVIVDAKAHGLGYLCSPKSSKAEEDDWINEAWHWLAEGEVAAPRAVPAWFSLPAMMRMTVSTPSVLGLLKGYTKPFNFVLVPLLFRNLYPAGKDHSNFSLIMPYSERRERWLETKAIDTHSGTQYSITLLNSKERPHRVEVKCYGNVLGAYREHPEAKFLGSDGQPCDLAICCAT